MLAGLFLLITLLFNVRTLAAALPEAGEYSVDFFGGKSLHPRQLLIANPAVYCCDDCTSAYSYDTYWHVFNDFCTWAGNGLELWTGQTYSTGSYYCQPGAKSCIHLSLQYLCGGGSAFSVTYAGCMAYFTFAISGGVCGGPPYPGAQIVSSGKCWTFRATADVPPSAAALASVSDVVSTCSGRHCDGGGSVKHTFSSTDAL